MDDGRPYSHPPRPEQRVVCAPNSRAALAAVRAALGPEAVVVGCREVSKGIFQGTQIEVTARPPDTPDTETPEEPAPPASGFDASAMRRAMARRTERVLRAGMPAVFDEPRKERLGRGKTAHPRTSVDDGDVARHPGPQPSVRTRILAELVDRGLDDDLATGLLEQACAGQPAERRRVLTRLRRVVREMVPVSRAPWTPDPTGDRNVIAMVGPTGVGKTTTAAKIAAKAAHEFGQAVALITIDTYRVGSIQQITKYGALLQIPTYVARDGDALRRALDDTMADLVIIDTAGRSPRDHGTLAHQVGLLHQVPEVRIHWVVPAATSARALSTFEARSIELSPDRLIVSKLDEASDYATIVNVASRVDAPLSCFTDGQRIFGDIKAATHRQLAGWLVPDVK